MQDNTVTLDESESPTTIRFRRFSMLLYPLLTAILRKAEPIKLRSKPSTKTSLMVSSLNG